MQFVLLSTGALTALCLFVPAPTFSQDATGIPGLVTPEGWQSERSGGDVVLTPGDLEEGTFFKATIKPLKPLSDSTLREWLTDYVDATAARGMVGKREPIERLGQTEILTATRSYQDGPGKAKAVLYIAFATPQGQARLLEVETSPDKPTIQANLPPILKMFLSMAKSAGAGTSAASKSGDDAPKKNVRSERKPKPTYRTTPGAGIKPSQIVGVYMILSYEMGVGGYMYPVYNPVLFLKDGTYCENTDVPPGDLDVAASKRGQPTRWGRWKRVGDKIQMQAEKGKWSDPKKIQVAQPGRNGEKLTGRFASLGGGGNVAFGGGTMIAVEDSYTFSPNGTFKSGKSVGASSAEPTSDVSVVTSSQKSSEGTYSIDGYTLTLRYSNGVVERRFFAFMDAKDRDAIYIDGSAYLLKKPGD